MTGQSNGDTVNFALGSGTFTYAAPFAMGGLSQVNFNSGTVFVDGTIQATTLAVNSGGTAAGTGLLVGDVTVDVWRHADAGQSGATRSAPSTSSAA